MITNAEREQWPGDVLIPESKSKGLLIDSKVRTSKLSPVETKTASFLGRLDDETYAEVKRQLLELIG